MTYAIIDTSSIIYGFSNGRSVFEAVSLEKRWVPLVSKGILKELSIISKNKGRKGSSARVAIGEVALRKVRVAASLEYPDRWIRAMSGRHRGIIVITNDTVLARKLPNDTMVFKFSINGKLRPFR